MKRVGIKNILAIGIFIPSLGVLILISLLVINYLNFLEETFNNNGELLTAQLVASSEYGVTTGNVAVLESTVQNLLKRQDIISINIKDSEKHSLVSKTKSGNRSLDYQLDYKSSVCKKLKRSQIFCGTIVSIPLQTEDFSTKLIATEQVVGFIEVELSRSAHDSQINDIIALIVLVTSVGLLGIYFTFRVIDRNISQPIVALTETVEKIGQGDFSARESHKMKWEFNTLQRGINSMAVAIEELNNEQKQKIYEATQSLTKTLEELNEKNHALDIERQKANEASLAKSQFLATMSHEIRTPLSGMLGMLSVLESSDLDQDQLGYVSNLEDAANSLRMLIDEILDFSRIEAGKLTIVIRPFSIRKLIDEVMTMFGPSAHQKNIELFADIPTEFPDIIHGDQLRIRQVLINLTSNAIKFTEKGEVYLVLKCMPKENSELSEIYFEVNDTGIGIPEDKQDLIFDSFMQIDANKNRRYSGSGLGTTTSRQLVELMGGEIGVKSELGVGSQFWVRLNCITESGEGYPRSLDQKNIVILEQHEHSRQILASIFLALGANVVSVDSSDNLYNHIRTSRAILDYILLSENSAASEMDRVALGLRNFEWREGRPKLIHLIFFNGTSDHHLYDLRMSKPFSLNKFYSKLFEKQISEQLVSDNETDNRPLKVLVAEDDEINAKVVTFILEKNGHQTVRVINGIQALDKLRTEHFDLVLMDVRMPELDGPNAVSILRAEEEGYMPIIALTANIEERASCESAGMDAFLVKPVDEKTLNSTIKSVLDNLV